MTAKQKNLLFTIGTLLLPALFFFVLEGCLKMFGYGGDLNLLRKVTVYGKSYYQLNPKVGHRYFRSDQIAVPELYPELLTQKKHDSLKRIICLGGSTTAGFPFEMNARYSFMMEQALNQALGDKWNWEVVNVGMSAINSFSVLDFMDELATLKPDLYLIYMGHNEFYGALGVGSTEGLGGNRKLIRLFLKLNRWRTFRLLRHLVWQTRRVFGPREPGLPVGTLMEHVAGEKAIPYGSKLYNLARSHYRANLREIIKRARDQGAEVLMSNLVCNIKDQPPFVSGFSDSTSPEVREHWQLFFEQGKSELQKGDLLAAERSFRHAVEIAPAHALGYYYLGKVYLQLGRQAEAKDALRRAADLDLLRFRATEEWNQIIREETAAAGIGYVDLWKRFSDVSSQGVPGNELFWEHLHPNLSGYALMAAAFLEAIREQSQILPPEDWPANLHFRPTELIRLANVSEMDRKIAEWKIKKLTARWPFQPSGQIRPLSPESWQDSLAIRYLLKAVTWSDVHISAAERFDRFGLKQKALREYGAVALVRPDAFAARVKMGILYLELNKPDSAAFVLEQAVRINPNSIIAHYRLGTAFLLMGKNSQALLSIRKARELNKQRGELQSWEMVLLDYSEALALIGVGRNREAEGLLARIVERAPEFAAAKNLLEKLRQNPNISIQFDWQSMVKQ